MVTGKKMNEKQLITVNVEALKDKLNSVYLIRREHKLMSHKNGRADFVDAGLADAGLFEYLWDLKEKALVEHKAQVDVPNNWLEQLDVSSAQGLGH